MSKRFSCIEYFQTLRAAGGYYVDKTGFLEDLLDESADVRLFTRPRRFGKTMTLSMIADFLDVTRDSRKNFEGLKVSENVAFCNKWMNQYPVVSITLKGINGKNFEEAYEQIKDYIARVIRSKLYLLSSEYVDEYDKRILTKLRFGEGDLAQVRNALSYICSALHRHHGLPPVLLIDEYDAPLTQIFDTMDNSDSERLQYYNKMLRFIQGFLSEGLKSTSDRKCAFITGVMPIAKECFGSQLNNIVYYDIATEAFASLFGFTEKEIDTLLDESGFSQNKIEIQEWYDGYRFGASQEIYCPWSVISHLHRLQEALGSAPQAYWADTAASEIARYLVSSMSPAAADRMVGLLDGQSVFTTIHTIFSFSYNDIFQNHEYFWTLLYFMGYLTVAIEKNGRCSSRTGKEAHLVIPNKEIKNIVEEKVLSWFSSSNIEKKTAFFRSFWAADADEAQKVLGNLISSTMSFFDYHEYWYHAFLLGIFRGAYDNTMSNRELGLGRPDIVVRDSRERRAAVIEVKRAAEQHELEQAVESGMQQIRERRYDMPLRSEGFAVILLWSMAFCRKSCLLKAERVVLQ